MERMGMYTNHTSYNTSNEGANQHVRLKVYTAVVCLLFAILFGRLWYLQVVQGTKFWALSEENRIRLIRVKAPRGIISDTDGFVLVRNRPSFNVFIIPEDVQELDKTIQRLGRLLPVSQEQILDKLDKSRRPKFEPVLIARDVNLQTVAYLEEHKIELPGVIVEVEPRRYNIYDSVASHVVGYLGEITGKQLKAGNVCPDCRQGDLIGQYGIEKSFNLFLNGKPGGKQVEVNAHGREIGTISRKNPMPGNNIDLTLNLHIQLIAEDALGDKPGAIVAINPQNGHILAMVSRPAFNPNLFAGGISVKNWQALINNPNHPLQNKTIQSHYAPGSTFKIPVGAALLQNGIVTPQSRLHCAGSVHLANTVKRCWKAGGHGYVNIKQALEQSCNVFYYRAGLELGIDELSRYATSFGFGERSGIALPNEEPGLIPTREWKREYVGDRWYPSETMDAAIGQGFVSVTPLQLANMVAAVANGGTLYKPLLIKRITKPNGDLVQEYEPTPIRNIPVDDQYLQIIREGLWMVVNGDRGTARGSKLKDFEFAGKTGTAQVVGMKHAAGDEEDMPFKLRDHGWFVCFAPADKPEIAMAILVEHGLGGSKSAAPIAKKIFERLYQRQDYFVKHERETNG
jgi:penicillin-binding protein 2